MSDHSIYDIIAAKQRLAAFEALEEAASTVEQLGTIDGHRCAQWLRARARAYVRQDTNTLKEMP